MMRSLRNARFRRSTLAAALAASVLGSVAAAPSPKPPPKSAPKKPAPPAVSKYRQHILQMLKVSAPGDEYFGRLKMSYLGIDNTFRDESVRAGAYTTDSRIVSQVNFAEEALRQWYNRYPHDPQLPRSFFLAYAMYRKIWTQPGQNEAWVYLHLIEERWPSSYFGKLVKKDQTGFTEHYFMDPSPCPATEAPSSTPSPGGRRSRPTPTPSPTPTPTPPPPTPTPAPGQPAIDILPVPCYTPAPPTPSPTPSVVPSATPTIQASGSPHPFPSGALTPTPRISSTPSPAPTKSPQKYKKNQ
ncbi:MAG TPA: hypothetical protein VGR69_01955 [Candidatus Rubrimentiphilum sp.]|nr:hypothetical protein [Candidatus Rubrimentiphilum sp.]